MVHPCGTPGLGAWDQVSCYCERALDAGFWAEPLNATSNLAFLAASLLAYADYRAAVGRRGGEHVRPVLLFLILWVMVIGAGSFLFHTLATKWALLADVIPIGIFVFVYLFYAARTFLGLGIALSLGLALAVAIGSQLLPPWFNGSFGYAPPLLAMIVVGGVLKVRGHHAGKWILSAAAVFTLSLTFRTLDGGAGCFTIPSGASEPDFIIGTHPLWHVLNAVTLYLLLRAGVEDVEGGKNKKRAPR